MAACPPQKFESRNEYREVGKKMETPPTTQGVVWPYFTCRNDRSGGSLEITTHDDGCNGPGVSYMKKHWNGTGYVINHAGEYEFRACNGANYGYNGGVVEHGGGNKQSSFAGVVSSVQPEVVAHSGKGKYGSSGTMATLPGRGTNKISCDVGAADICPGDRAVITAGKHAIAATEFTAKATGNFTIGGSGTGSISSDGDMACGSHKGCTQLGGKGVILSSQGGPMSAYSSGVMSLYTGGANIIMSSGGGNVYINSIPPVTTDQAVAASKKPGTQNVAGLKIRSRQSTMGSGSA